MQLSLARGFKIEKQQEFLPHLDMKIKMFLRYGTSQKIVRFDNLK